MTTFSRQIVNKFFGTCSCGAKVQAGQGFARLLGNDKKWLTLCAICATESTPTPAVRQPDLAARPTYPLTDEQQAIVGAFLTGESIAIEAGAGTGKTSTLVAIAKSTNRIGKYTAFNKAIVAEANIKFAGTNTSAQTFGSLAFRQIGTLYAGRLNDRRRRSSQEIAKALDIEPFFYAAKLADGSSEQRVIQPKTLASYVAKTIDRFCDSADEFVSSAFTPYIEGIDTPDENGRRTFANNNAVRSHIERAVKRAWMDLIDPEGAIMRFTPSHTFKIWQLGLHGAPRIHCDFLLVDEAQDVNPVALSVIEQQGVQIVWVGDSQQQIYDWRGAVNALASVSASTTLFLTETFRFGPEIAAAANKILATIESAKLRIRSNQAASTICATDTPNVILTRSNAGAVGAVLDALDKGRSVHLVGGGGDVEAFAKGARELQTTGRTDHPELAIFESWSQVVDFAVNDPSGEDISLLVKLIEKYGVEKVLRAVANVVSQEQADLVVSTAHKAKGLEWDKVQLAGDFTHIGSDSERRLVYVAITRARKLLDISRCGALVDLLESEDEARPFVPGSEQPESRAVPAPEAAPAPQIAPEPVQAPAFQRRNEQRTFGPHDPAHDVETVTLATADMGDLVRGGFYRSPATGNASAHYSEVEHLAIVAYRYGDPRSPEKGKIHVWAKPICGTKAGRILSAEIAKARKGHMKTCDKCAAKLAKGEV